MKMFKTKIEFHFNNIISIIQIPLNSLLQNKESLKQIITYQCNYHLSLDVIEDNIILYDEEHNVIIDGVQNLLENKTKKCKILFNEILFIFNNSKITLQIEIEKLQLEGNLKHIENIVLHDIKNDKIIESIQDLIENKTKVCKIIIIPINY